MTNAALIGRATTRYRVCAVTCAFAIALTSTGAGPGLAQTNPPANAQPAAPYLAPPPPAVTPAPAETQPSAGSAPSAAPGQPAPAAGAATQGQLPSQTSGENPAGSVSQQPDASQPAVSSETPAATPEAESGATQQVAAPPVIGSAQLPHDLTPWGMFMAADWVVKAVMIGLAFASVVTWTVWLAKSLELMAIRRRARRAGFVLGKAPSVEDAAKRMDKRHGVARQFIDSAVLEMEMSSDTRDKEGVKERVASRLDRIEAAAGRRVTRGTSVLATIGATAPFVGLFGTVWGIMNSFIGISQSQTTSLAVVAPGIAEALLATAMGLVAAIPAVMIYNAFARSITGYRAVLGDASAEVLRLVSRDLDRHAALAAHQRQYPTAAE
ncbi:MAG TPA: tonB-system energizer ExbB [Xanthobacteraceae bacterium]|nr:tonB-system energizer ExbB [Xanthobacteraceae bacterium]